MRKCDCGCVLNYMHVCEYKEFSNKLFQESAYYILKSTWISEIKCTKITISINFLKCPVCINLCVYIYKTCILKVLWSASFSLFSSLQCLLSLQQSPATQPHGKVISTMEHMCDAAVLHLDSPPASPSVKSFFVHVCVWSPDLVKLCELAFLRGTIRDSKGARFLGE